MTTTAPPLTAAVPFWMKQRQVKVEPISDTALKLVAPQLPNYEIEIRQEAGAWHATLFQSATEGGERKLVSETTYAEPTPWHAWQAAFELYRQAVII